MAKRRGYFLLGHSVDVVRNFVNLKCH